MSSDRYEKVSVVMPVYNEPNTLEPIIERVLAAPVDLDIELVIVDDGSTDRTPQITAELAGRDPRIALCRHERNRGKGAAVRTGLERAGGQIVIIQDADLEYDPTDYAVLIEPILAGQADAVYGSRFASQRRRVLYFWHQLGNKFLTWLSNMVNDLNLTDMLTCYKAVRRDVIDQLLLKSNRFGLEAEITAKLVAWGARIYEVPVSYHGRSYAENRKTSWRDGLKMIGTILRYRYLDHAFCRDPGFVVLQSIHRARRFNRWLFSRIRPHLGRRVFEAGSGIGSFTEFMLDRDRLIAGEIETKYVELLSDRYGHLRNLRLVPFDLTDESAYAQLSDERIDTVVCLNVLEHLPDDAAVLERFHNLLEPGGRAIILVPACGWLFAPLDVDLGHHRRYERRQLEDRMRQAGFEVVVTYKFNKFGFLTWLLMAKLLRRRSISPRQMRIYNLITPLARAFDAVAPLPGLSLICVGRRPAC